MNEKAAAIGIRQMMSILQRGMLKQLLDAYVPNLDGIDWGHETSDTIIPKLYNMYLSNASTEEWYKFCATLYDISLVSNSQKKNTTFLKDQIKISGGFDKFRQDIDQPSSASLQTILAWIHLNLKPLWNHLAQEAYNDQIKSGGRKFYLKIHPFTLPEEKRRENFQYEFASYMTENRSLVKNVHIECDPFGEIKRYVIYYDPAPKKQNEFNEKGKLGTAPDKEVEYFCIVFTPQADQPYISVKGEFLSSEQTVKAAELFITVFLNSEITSKKIEQYDMTRFNVRGLCFPNHSEVVNWRPKLIRLYTDFPNGEFEENTFSCSTGDVYVKCCNSYCDNKKIRDSWRRFCEVRLELTIYTGVPPPKQKCLFGGEMPSVDRHTATYEVKITSRTRQVLKCRDDDDRKKIESILDSWGIVDLNDKPNTPHVTQGSGAAA